MTDCTDPVRALKTHAANVLWSSAHLPACQRGFNGFLGEVLAVQDSQRLLQGLDLLLAPGNPVFVADSSVNAGWLQLVEVGESSVELLLSGLKITLLGGERLGLVLLLRGLVLDVAILGRQVDLGVLHELIVLLRGCGLSG